MPHNTPLILFACVFAWQIDAIYCIHIGQGHARVVNVRTSRHYNSVVMPRAGGCVLGLKNGETILLLFLYCLQLLFPS